MLNLSRTRRFWKIFSTIWFWKISMWPLNYQHILASVTRYVRTKWVVPNKCGTFLCIGSNKCTRASPPARKMQLFSSNLNMQNSVVMFTFSNFDRKYHFWVKLVQKIKIVSLFWNLAPRLIRICVIQWRCSIFVLFI